MHDIMSDLKHWREAVAVRHHDAEFKVPVPTLNLGRIQGGDSPNRICASCELLFDIRVMPRMVIAEALGEIEDRVRARGALAGVAARLELPLAPLPALDTPASSPLVTALEALTGETARTVAFATEGPFLNALGCDTVICGPGDIATAHQPNEHVEIARIDRMIGITRSLIERFCCGD